jgi:L-asparaginase II
LLAARDGIAVVIKCLDGSQRPNTAVAVTLLERHGVIDAAARDTLISQLVEPITGGSAVVGKLAVSI